MPALPAGSRASTARARMNARLPSTGRSPVVTTRRPKIHLPGDAPHTVSQTPEYALVRTNKETITARYAGPSCVHCMAASQPMAADPCSAPRRRSHRPGRGVPASRASTTSSERQEEPREIGMGLRSIGWVTGEASPDDPIEPARHVGPFHAHAGRRIAQRVGDVGVRSAPAKGGRPVNRKYSVAPPSRRLTARRAGLPQLLGRREPSVPSMPAPSGRAATSSVDIASPKSPKSGE